MPSPRKTTTLEKLPDAMAQAVLDGKAASNGVDFAQASVEPSLPEASTEASPVKVADVVGSAPTPVTSTPEPKPKSLVDIARDRLTEAKRQVELAEAGIAIETAKMVMIDLLQSFIDNKDSDTRDKRGDIFVLALAEIKTPINLPVWYDVEKSRIVSGTTMGSSDRMAKSIPSKAISNNGNGTPRAQSESITMILDVAAPMRGSKTDRKGFENALRTRHPDKFPPEWKGFVDGHGNSMSTHAIKAWLDSKGFTYKTNKS